MDLDPGTPTKPSNNGRIVFSPITLRESPAIASAHKNLTGSPRVVRDILADVYNTVQHWNDYHIIGAKLVKEIASIKKNTHKMYSDSLEVLILELCDTVHKMSVCLKNLEMAALQMNSLQKLEPNKILFISLSTDRISDIITEIWNDYKKELEVKQLILENIAHEKNINIVMFYAALWTHQQNISDTTNLKVETLVMESGHKKIV